MVVCPAATFGVEYVFATVVLAGIFQISARALKLVKLMQRVNQPVSFDFVNAITIIIFTFQLKQYKTEEGIWMTSPKLYSFGWFY